MRDQDGKGRFARPTGFHAETPPYDYRSAEAGLRRKERGFKIRYGEDLTPDENVERDSDLKSRGWLRDN